MGVGTPANLLECISLGIDMFDCVIPTRNGRNGWIYTRRGILNMKNEKWKNDFSPLDEEGDAFSDQIYSKAYLRHLFVSGEILAPMIASLHNLRFFTRLMEDAREHIINGSFSSWKNKIMPGLRAKL
jgi:queuine tRNA-ribosyltransferase